MLESAGSEVSSRRSLCRSLAAASSDNYVARRMIFGAWRSPVARLLWERVQGRQTSQAVRSSLGRFARGAKALSSFRTTSAFVLAHVLAHRIRGRGSPEAVAAFPLHSLSSLVSWPQKAPLAALEPRRALSSVGSHTDRRSKTKCEQARCRHQDEREESEGFSREGDGEEGPSIATCTRGENTVGNSVARVGPLRDQMGRVHGGNPGNKGAPGRPPNELRRGGARRA
jgi:hypothetical protein